jgi:hypothetical protein
VGKKLTPEQREQHLRRALFVPCETKEALHKWIRHYLGLDVPNCIVEPTSNSSPMDMIWEIYDSLRRGGSEDMSRVLYYASRDSFKTLGAAILEVLAVVHLRLSVAHMAAIEAQSIKSQMYVKGFFGKAFLREYIVGDSKEITKFQRYLNKVTGENLTLEQYEELPEGAKAQYTVIENYIRIVICTMAGANSEHVPLLVVDEVDVVRDPKAYEQAKLIPAQWAGTLPVTVLTSTRKFAFGMVQKEMDEEFGPDGDRRLHIRHWNIIDVTESCAPTRHLPELPKIPIYVDEDRLRAISEDQYKLLPPDELQKFRKEEGYQGCLKNCRLFSACHGRLATEQKSKSPLLKSVADTLNKFRGLGKNIEMAQAELLCKKPSKKGLIYPNLDRSVHLLTPAQMAEKLTGDTFRPDFTKAELIALMQTRDVKWYAGQDYGWTHNFADVTGAVDGARCFIVNVVSAPQLMPDQIVRAVDHLKRYGRAVFGDPEDPKMVAMLRAAGHRMRAWHKEPGSVVGGINVVRMRLTPTMGEPLLFFLAGDPMVELLFKRMSEYHWKLDPTGTLVDGEPDEENDDECDALRYLVMNVFAPKGKVKAAKEPEHARSQETPAGVYTRENLFSKILEERGVVSGGGESADQAIGRRGSVKWDMS